MNKLAQDVSPDDTTLTLITSGDYTDFPDDGGFGFFSDKDSFWYTSRTDNVLEGVSGLNLPHEIGDYVFLTLGDTFGGLLTKMETSQDIDKEGLAAVFSKIIDEGVREHNRKRVHAHRLKNPVFMDASMLFEYLKELEIPAAEGLTEDEDLRMLAIQIVSLLRGRFSKYSFSLLIYLLLGYQSNIWYSSKWTPAVLGSPYGVALGAPEEPEVSRGTLGLWRIANPPALEVTNEANSVIPLVLSDAGCWVTSSLCSMFEKDSILEVDNTAVPAQTCTIDGSLERGVQVNRRKSLFIESFIKLKDDSGGSFPQEVLAKDGVVKVFRMTNDSLKVSWYRESSEVSSLSWEDFPVGKWVHLVVGYTPNRTFLLVDGDMDSEWGDFDFLTDDGNDWEVGVGSDIQMYLDFLDIRSAGNHITDFLDYYQHIKVLRSVYSGDDMTTYTYSEDCEDGLLRIEITNDDFDETKHQVLDTLVESWIEAGYTEVMHLPHPLLGGI